MLMPGFTEGGDSLGGVTDALQAEYRVVVADLPGSGRSGPQPRAYPSSFYSDDAHTMAALLRHLGIEQAHVAGFSDGGEVALLMAVLYPDTVRSVIEWGAAGTLNGPDVPTMLAAIGHMMDDETGDLSGWRSYLIAAYGEQAARETIKSWTAASKAILTEGGDISLSCVDEIRCPALLISGALDPFAMPAMTRELASRIPNSTYHIVPEVGHDVHLQRPRWFVETVLSWLERV